jgi:hypothetical protein
MEKVKCLLCGGSMPADDLLVQIEHMVLWHKATSTEEAERMVRDNFVNPYPEEHPKVLHNGFQSIDRRKNPRKKLEARLILNPLNTADFHVGWIQNISMGGIRVKTEIQPLPFTIDNEVGFFLDMDAFNFVGKGRLIWTSDIDSEVGVKFTQLAEETRKPLERFLESLP